ncbi:hypothetical protein RBH20_15600 [Haloarcula sp. H-GB4]|uniref:hypothetical protein n=1 Tax=Haloarcula sp. H-GB4 TaxID=3069755 RepID=UPI0027B565DB|nr:hypothetical protein [Haloarcula sp. H-GB4]MDQ2073960.1 hypothetical protein [Haloarcula sp. H-GB4]
MRTKLFALYAAVGLILLAVGPGLAAAADSAGNTSAGNTLAVGVSQADDGSATVSVTQNETGVENTSVAVETADNTSYAGSGNYTTDSDGTVGLPAPEQNVTVDVTATTDNHTATTTADLTVAPNATNMTEFDTFGLEVSAYVSDVLSDENRTGGIGPAVASFVTANNPGNAPDHAGPPAHVTGENESDDNETHPSERQGPPADIFGDDENETGDENETDDRRGPPEDRGPDRDDDEAENETDDDNETADDRRGPPADAGPPDDRDDDDVENETEDDENETEKSEDEAEDSEDVADSDDDVSDDADDGDRGRPDDAGPPDERGN